jgi:AraC-like DNA-binding protein
MRCLSILFFILLSGIGLSAQHIEEDHRLLDSLLNKHHDMHFYQSPTIGRSDSVWHRYEGYYLYFDTDLICQQYVSKGGFNAIPDEMDYLFFAVFTEMQPDQRMIEIQKMEEAAKKYNSQALMYEAELQQIFCRPVDTEEQYNDRLLVIRALQQQFAMRNDILMMIRTKEYLLNELYYHHRTMETLEEAIDIVKLLDEMTDEQYIGRRHLYFFIGEIFYAHGYNEQGTEMMKKALKDAAFFFDRSNLRALNNLGVYCRNEGDLDMSDRYFRSMLESCDNVKYRGEYDAIAICNLGKNYLLRKEYDKAERLLQKGLSVLVRFDPTFSAGVYLSLGKCFLAERKLPQTKAMIDSVVHYNTTYQFGNEQLYVDLYPLMSNYYMLTGDLKTSEAYSDSAVVRYRAYQKQYNDTHIFKVEKKLYDAEKKVKEEQLAAEKTEKEKYRSLLIATILIIILSGCYYFFFNRLRRQKNRMLYKRMKEEIRIQDELSRTQQLLMSAQNNKTPGVENNNAPSEIQLSPRNNNTPSDEHNLLQRLSYLMQFESLYTDSELSRKTVANRLFTNETYLVYAIKKGCNGQSFSDYLNALRVMHARRLLQNNPALSIKEIASTSGFTSYKYFHKRFHYEYGMSPSEFRAVSIGD